MPEGVFSANWSDIKWVADCHGDTYSIYPSDNVYVASRQALLWRIGGFPRTIVDL